MPQELVALEQAVARVLAVDPVGLTGPVALQWAQRLLRVREQVATAGLIALAQVHARELWQDAHCCSTRGWLRVLPCGDVADLPLATALPGRPVLQRALAAGLLSVRSARQLSAQLDRVPAVVPAEQLHEVLVHGLPQALATWLGSGCLEATEQQEAEFAARHDLLMQVVAAGVAAGVAAAERGPVAQLEPVLVLLAEALAPAQAVEVARELVDAVQPVPEGPDPAEDEVWRERAVRLRRRRGGGWQGSLLLTDETGAALLAVLQERRQLVGAGPAAAPACTGVTDAEAAQRAGQPGQSQEPGSAAQQAFLAALDRAPSDRHAGATVSGSPPQTRAQRDHDVLGAVLLELLATREDGSETETGPAGTPSAGTASGPGAGTGSRCRAGPARGW